MLYEEMGGLWIAARPFCVTVRLDSNDIQL